MLRSQCDRLKHHKITDNIMRISPRWANTIYLLVVIFIVGLSFRALAPQFSPNLNSDHAVHVMMTYDLQLPNDLYFWGQDRLGSLVPIVSHFALKLVPIAPVAMVGIVSYLVLLVAYCCFASFFQGILSKLLLATAFFLPLRLYVEILHISQPYAAQFACLGLSSVGVRWLLIHWATANRWRKNLGLVFTLAFMVASLWVSSFSIVYLVVLLGAIAHYIFILTPSHERRQRYPLDISTGLAAGITGAFGLGFLKLAKASASNSSDYTKLNSLAQFTDLLQRIGQNVLRNLRFEVHRIWMPLAVWCLVAIAGCSLYFIWRYRHNLFSAVSGATHQKGPLWPPTLWFGVWGLTAGLSMGILLIANWVYQTDHIPQRYFVVIYGLCWLTVLSLVEILPKRPQLTLFVLLILFTGFSIKTLPPRLFSTPAQSPMVKQLEVLNTLGPAGFIGEYWHSYVLCSANPQLFN
ncbi:MAG: hypothetical protein F6K09_30310 [Merismopedia sp. SIO2A8]|nr:hypothetical protein [Merismopedia sp. SIO2A8]